MASVSDHELIRNAIALNCLAFDKKDWHLTKQCFTEDCVVDYPEPLGIIRGLSAYTERLQKAIGHLQTQHALTTQIIDITSDVTASAMTYSRAIHFLDGKTFFAEGRYEDELVRVTVDGKRRWLIKERKVVTMGVPRGDWSLLH
ncbi:hypothetical protein NM208_g711 [Fusarium decemcellulare]|uniref:Uncharacterized protein n=1 Tax=Fusarium decemcellulare TaxID=57161 RepID=A0ACC1SYK5_9HYPO|nr:hypothetical protein NM208_g711 [Fusarium decemcellulare]